jgi:hypothetical protein
MSFFTEINIPEFSPKMDYSKCMMLFGSCFSENIGQKLLDLKFSVDMNPFGILYNPESIANSLKILLEKRVFTASDLFFDQGLWSSFYHHSRFSGVNSHSVLENINSRINASHQFLKSAEFLAITFGTSWVYELKSSQTVVSNCHKIPVAEFTRFRLDVTEIADTWQNLLEKIWEFNPGLKVIFTVSPIRHWKDGAVENQVSKATLLLAIDRLKSRFGEQAVSYFPSYEIMMDELRDYRFYADDMLHLSEVAVDYVFDRFRKTMISKESMDISKHVVKIRKAFQHRPVNPASAEYVKFLKSNLAEINKLTLSFPSLNFDPEKEHFERELLLYADFATKSK